MLDIVKKSHSAVGKKFLSQWNKSFSETETFFSLTLKLLFHSH